MRPATVILASLGVLTLFIAKSNGEGAGATRFDGIWSVNLVCPDHKEPNGWIARGFSFQFVAHVKNGVIHGEHGGKGAPSWLSIDGTIQPDGTANLDANGLTGLPEHTLGRVKSGTPYEYLVKAHFDSNQGTGARVGGRIGNYTFIKWAGNQAAKPERSAASASSFRSAHQHSVSKNPAAAKTTPSPSAAKPSPSSSQPFLLPQ